MGLKSAVYNQERVIMARVSFASTIHDGDLEKNMVIVLEKNEIKDCILSCEIDIKSN